MTPPLQKHAEAVDEVIDVLKARGVNVRVRHFQRSTWFLLIDGDIVVELSMGPRLFLVDGSYMQEWDAHAAATAVVESAEGKRRAKVEEELRREARAAEAVEANGRAPTECPSCEDGAVGVGTDDMGVPTWILKTDEGAEPIDYCPYCGLRLPMVLEDGS